MSSHVDASIARMALGKLPAGTSHGERIKPQDVYLPRSHLKAVEPDVLLVTGMRGAGKTFWWSALQEGVVRRLMVQSSERTTLSENTEVRVGFGVTSAPSDYPGVDSMRSLRMNREPRDIWRTVLAWQLAKGTEHPLADLASWESRTHFVASHAEAVDGLLQERDAEYDWNGVDFLLLFDGLDRCAEDWTETNKMVRALLQVALETRSYQRLRIKVFLRSDHASDRAIAAFPDASKVLATKVELTWPTRELYGLLWHHLANGHFGDVFRSYLSGNWPSATTKEHTVYPVPRRFVVNEDAQREKFHSLVGERMGGSFWRAKPYSWITDHLADAQRRVSARSFLAALRAAAHHTEDEHPDHDYGLHHKSIDHGVQEASAIRIWEMQEDYPWIDRAMSALRGMSVPVPFEEFAERWREERVVESLSADAELAPRHLADGEEGVRRDLEAQGVFQRLLDGRVNIPDVYRVGYGLGRRGGVRPVQQQGSSSHL